MGVLLACTKNKNKSIFFLHLGMDQTDSGFFSNAASSLNSSSMSSLSSSGGGSFISRRRYMASSSDFSSNHQMVINYGACFRVGQKI